MNSPRCAIYLLSGGVNHRDRITAPRCGEALSTRCRAASRSPRTMNGARARKVSRCCCCSLRPKPRTLARFDDLTTILLQYSIACVCVCVCAVSLQSRVPVPTPPTTEAPTPTTRLMRRHSTCRRRSSGSARPNAAAKPRRANRSGTSYDTYVGASPSRFATLFGCTKYDLST